MTRLLKPHAADQPLLFDDNLDEWLKQNKGKKRESMLSDWVHRNVVHVVQSCPTVLAHWSEESVIGQPEKTLHRWLAHALEHLSDEDKIRVIRGSTRSGRAHAMLHDFLYKSANNWGMLSPAWIGHPESALRAVAIEAGWIPYQLMTQVWLSLHQSGAEQWTAWVPFPHSIAVVHRYVATEFQLRRNETGPEALHQVSTAWANPKDVALAQFLVKHAPLPLNYTLDAHESVPPLDKACADRLEALVLVHLGLGFSKVLLQGVLDGVLPEQAIEPPSLALPDMGAY